LNKESKKLKLSKMKKMITMIGIAGMLSLVPSCKKSEVKPEAPSVTNNSEARQSQVQDTASLYVMIDSKPCSTPQSQYTSASIDIRGIKVLNSEHGWEELTPVAGAWDVVSLQTAPVPVADITERSSVHTGTISKIALTFGDNNQLVVNDQAARCYNIGKHEIVLDMQGEIKANTLNEIVVSIDICGNISVHTQYDHEPCYTLNPVMAVQSFTQR
jgi:hypothetical protein